MIDGRLQFELAPGLDAPRLARRWLSESLVLALADGILTTAKLLVSELVTNAVTHGRGQITVRAELSERRLRVEVVDEGDGFELSLRARDLETPRPGGWGLSIVDAESSRWGVCRDSSRVWFELERPGAPVAAAVNDQIGRIGPRDRLRVAASLGERPGSRCHSSTMSPARGHSALSPTDKARSRCVRRRRRPWRP